MCTRRPGLRQSNAQFGSWAEKCCLAEDAPGGRSWRRWPLRSPAALGPVCRRTNHTPLPNIAVSRHSLRHTPPPQKYASLLPWYRGHSCFASHRSSLCDREQFTNRTSVTLLSLKIASQANAQHHVAALPSSLQRLRGLDESVPFLTAFLLSPVRMHLSG